MFDPMLPNREMFIQDPAGYSLSGWSRWAMLAAAHGADVDPTNAPSSDDLKSPILWLTQAEAMAQAAVTLVKQQPNSLLISGISCRACQYPSGPDRDSGPPNIRSV